MNSYERKKFSSMLNELKKRINAGDVKRTIEDLEDIERYASSSSEEIRLAITALYGGFLENIKNILSTGKLEELPNLLRGYEPARRLRYILGEIVEQKTRIC